MPEQTRAFDIEAEQAVLCAMMLNAKTITVVEALLTSRDFYRPAHQRIFEALLNLRDKQQPTDPIAVATHLAGANTLAQVGGVEYLHTCYALPVAAQSASHFATLVANYATLRNLTKVAEKVRLAVEKAHPDEAAETLEQSREWVAGLGTSIRGDTAPDWGDVSKRMAVKVDEASMSTETASGIPTGWPDVDDILGGMRPGELILVGARPGVGKSVVLLNLAARAAMKLKLRTVFFTLEMSEDEVWYRITSSQTGIPFGLIREGDLTDGQWGKFVNFLDDTEAAPLHVDQTAQATIAHVRSVAYSKIAQHGSIDLILVDYVQLTEGGSHTSRQEHISALSRGLKLLGKEIGVPVVAAAQLNRESEKRPDKLPTKSDLRESGSLEQDADVVILLHREDVRDHESPRAGECDVIIDKNRHGRTGTVTLAAQLHLARFSSMALDEPAA